jgi:phosphoserine phosphatase RsbU/P
MAAISEAGVRSALAQWLPYVAVAAICFAAGAAAIVLSLLRRRDRLLLWMGIMAVFYGLRLAWANDLVRFAFGAQSVIWPIAAMTYSINIPTALFFRELLGRGWKRSIEIWVWVQVAFAPIAIFAGWASGDWLRMDRVNHVLVVASVLLVAAHLAPPKTAATPPALLYSILLFGVLVIANNLQLGHLAFNLEPFGFLTLIIGLGYTAAQRAMARDQRLAAVESELETARRIQMSILPRRPPEIPGLRIAATYRPMTEVAGDFYDFIRLDDRRLTTLIADVSGHGVPAALIASMLKVGFAQQAPRAADPAGVLSGLNAALHGVLDGQFVTAACVYIDLAEGAIVYSGAGHPPALLIRRQPHEIVELAENGLFLGPFRNASYGNIRAPFAQGDRLLLYTDGVIEATFTDDEPFGAGRLREFASAHREAAPAAIAEGLVNKVGGLRQEDDLTVVVACAE